MKSHVDICSSARLAWVLVTWLMASLAHAQSVEELRQESVAIDQQVLEVDGQLSGLGGGVLKALAEMRREVLLLTKAALTARIQAAEDDGESVKTVVIVPTVEPDEAKAKTILGEIAALQAEVEEAQKEVELSGGLLKALAMAGLETKKLTLVQLQMAYLQASYGIAFPAVPEVQSTEEVRAETATEPVGDEAPAPAVVVDPPLEWADPRYPDIDYSIPFFAHAHQKGEQISGWWSIEESEAAIDDSPMVLGVNYSQVDPRGGGEQKALVVRCAEGQTALVYKAGAYLLSDRRSSGLPVTYRIDDAPPKKVFWRELTGKTGAGLFGTRAVHFIRTLYDATRLFLRVVERNGERHDALFDLSGSREVFDATAKACGWTVQSLSPGEYRAVQSALAAKGYSPGKPDGRWGPASRSAVRQFQAAVGLPESGIPDQPTLEKLGLGKEVKDGEEEAAADGERRAVEKRRAEYIDSIVAKVTRAWIRPPMAEKGLRCLLRIRQIPTGDVVSIQLVESSGDVSFDRSVERAVQRASPLPLPRDRTVFTREVVIEFRPG